MTVALLASSFDVDFPMDVDRAIACGWNKTVETGEIMGKFITFERGDGSGKSTQLRLTAAWLQSMGQRVVTTFEPGDTALGAKIRALLLSGEDIPVPECELLLFLADRAQHVRERLQPALQRGEWVLCDRFSDSTLAYQLAARKLGDSAGQLQQMLDFAECGVHPDMTLWFDLPVSVAVERMQMRQMAGEKSTRLDDEGALFHERVVTAFAAQAASDTERIVRIDAAGGMNAVQQQVAATLTHRFSL